MSCEVERDTAMVSRPLISISSARSSVRSAFPRMEPIAFLKKPLSDGESDIFRSRARRRDCFAESMSLVASSPTALRATSDSVTGRGLVKRVCQGALILAKPERRAMREIPITPTRERLASLRVYGFGSTNDGTVEVLPRSCPPAHQKPMIQHTVLNICKIHAMRSFPLLLPVNSHPAAEMTDWISREGIATMSRSNKSEIVKWNASRRAAASMVFDISQRINSTRTVASAIVVENVIADTFRMVSRDDGKYNELPRLCFDEIFPERIGKTF